jgi:hypothetical protein
MTARAFGENDVPPKHSVTRVDWFRRDPAGGTIFVKPAVAPASTQQAVSDCTDAGGRSVHLPR